MEFKKALHYYAEIISAEFIHATLESSRIRFRNGIYEASVVIWLMIFQRLSADCTLAAAVDELKYGATHWLLHDRASGSCRVRANKISSATGGYAQARERIPQVVVNSVAERISSSLISNVSTGEDTFIVDGTSLTLSHDQRIIKSYPQYKNYYGNAHFPMVRVGVAVHAESGVALTPTFGPANGSKATSEISLVTPLLAKIPTGSQVIADRFYGIFSFIAQLDSHQLKPVVRLRDAVCKRVAGQLPTTESGETRVLWKPSAHERKRYPELSDHAGIAGRIIWHTVQHKGFKPTRLLLFTTLELPLTEVVKLYGKRWDIEGDIRDIKSTLTMDFLSAQAPDVLEKEIVLGFVAYNLVRRLMVVAARITRKSVRELSFKATLRYVRAFGGFLLSSDEATAMRIEKHIRDFHTLLLPKRKTTRTSYPRKQWRRKNRAFRTINSQENKPLGEN